MISESAFLFYDVFRVREYFHKAEKVAEAPKRDEKGVNMSQER